MTRSSNLVEIDGVSRAVGPSGFKKTSQAAFCLFVERDTPAAEGGVCQQQREEKQERFPSLAQLMESELTGFN